MAYLSKVRINLSTTGTELESFGPRAGLYRAVHGRNESVFRPLILPTSMDAGEVIQLLGLEPIPLEGGYFRRSWTGEPTSELSGSKLQVAGRPLGTVIYALFTRSQFSALHRLGSDEVWHFYAGDAVDLLLLMPEGRSHRFRLGSDLAAGELPQCVVPAGVWQGARPKGQGRWGWSLVGCSMAPGFVPAEFALGDRKYLKTNYPVETDLIEQLTREVIIGPQPNSLN